MCPLETMEEPKKQLFESLLTLEAQAGLSKVMESARDGTRPFESVGRLARLEPFVKTHDDCGGDVKQWLEHFGEYNAKAQDHLRYRTRDAYFSVQEIELRQKLIAEYRKMDSLDANASNEAQQKIDRITFPALERAVQAAMEKSRNDESWVWVKAAILAAWAVMMGYWILGREGAIAGAIAGFFLGQGYLSKAKNDVCIGLEYAKNALEQAQKNRTQRHSYPDTFSRAEEITGGRDVHLDLEDSPHSNFLRSCRNVAG